MPVSKIHPHQTEEHQRQRHDRRGRDCHQIGTWNVRSLKGKDRKLVEKMKKYDLRVLGVSKMKWKGNGAMGIEDCFVAYSGVRELKTAVWK